MTRLVLAVAALCPLLTGPSTAATPNIVLILADDLGYADVGFNGCEDIRTPRIDQIASRGVRCTNGYAPHAVCSPSRAGMLAGRYQHRFGHERNPIFAPDDPNMGMPVDQVTLADVLRDAGYATGLIGKWHLGAHERFHPLNRGFDFFYGMLGGGHEYFPERLTVDEPKTHEEEYSSRLLRDRERVDETEYLTDAFSREAVAFIERSADQPFFLFLSYNAPHTPMQATDKYLDRYTDIRSGKRRTYAAMVSAMDDGVGRVLDALERTGTAERTILFFMSDNGGPTPSNASDNGPLRGIKGSPYEGGVRVPFAVRWDGVLPEGVDYEPPVSGLDIFATSIAAAGVGAPAGQSLDGVDLVPYLTGAADGRPHEALYWRLGGGAWKGKASKGSHAVRRGDMKLIRRGEGAMELFDLGRDLGERRNLRQKRPTAVQDLAAAIDAWDAELVEPRFLGLMQRAEYERMRRDERSASAPGAE